MSGAPPPPPVDAFLYGQSTYPAWESSPGPSRAMWPLQFSVQGCASPVPVLGIQVGWPWRAEAPLSPPSRGLLCARHPLEGFQPLLGCEKWSPSPDRQMEALTARPAQKGQSASGQGLWSLSGKGNKPTGVSLAAWRVAQKPRGRRRPGGRGEPCWGPGAVAGVGPRPLPTGPLYSASWVLRPQCPPIAVPRKAGTSL